MAGSFYGRWADVTMSRRICRPYRGYFCLLPVMGAMVFLTFAFQRSSMSGLFAKLPDGVTDALRWFDAVALPRSIGDLSAISERMGHGYFIATLLLETLCATGGLFLLVVTLIRCDFSSIADDFSAIQFWLRLMVVVASLVIRPPHFANLSLTANYIHRSGFFLLRESGVIAVGYYFLTLMMVDIAGRTARRFRGSHKIVTTEPRDLRTENERR